MTLLAVGAVGAALLAGYAYWDISSGLDEISEVASRYPGDRVEALMELVADSDRSLKTRNRAVWALGQIGDARALPLLEEHYTGEECDHSRLLCQRELRKAIARCRDR